MLLDANIIFTLAGEREPWALQAVPKDGRAVCVGIHISDIWGIPYSILWEERE